MPNSAMTGIAKADREMRETSREELLIAQITVRNAIHRWIYNFEPFTDDDRKIWQHLINAAREIESARKVFEGEDNE